MVTNTEISFTFSTVPKTAILVPVGLGSYFARKLGMSNRARSDIRMFASGIWTHPDVRIVYVKAYCSIYVKIALTMKDGGFADENVGWTCLPSTPERSERFKFDVNIISIISSYISRIMTKIVFGLRPDSKQQGCTL